MSFLVIGSSKRRPIEALYRVDRVVRIGDGLALGRLSDEALAVLGESDDGGRGARTFRIFDHLRLAAFHHRDAAVGRAQIDPDNLTHVFPRKPAYVSAVYGVPPPHGADGCPCVAGRYSERVPTSARLTLHRAVAETSRQRRFSPIVSPARIPEPPHEGSLSQSEEDRAGGCP